MNNNRCRVCGKEIHLAIYKGTGICSGNCRKKEQKEQ